MQVVLYDAGDRLVAGLTFLLSNRKQHVKRFHEEVPAAAGWVKEPELFRCRRKCGEVVLDLIFVVNPPLPKPAFRVERKPPCAERVLEQELDHVRLGEELRHGANVCPLNLPPRLVDLLLLFGLPELVRPAERVLGTEGLRWESLKDPLQGCPVLRSVLQEQERVVVLEDARQHPGSVIGGDLPLVNATASCDLCTFGERDRRMILRVNE
ncbi:hypothetical protein DSECCO2_571790 [anaerobic digester metagenome]